MAKTEQELRMQIYDAIDRSNGNNTVYLTHQIMRLIKATPMVVADGSLVVGVADNQGAPGTGGS